MNLIKFSGYIVDPHHDLTEDELERWIKSAGIGYKLISQHMHIKTANVDKQYEKSLMVPNCDLSICERNFHESGSSMKYERDIPKPGEYWRHFKIGKIVMIVGISKDTEFPDSYCVVYKDLDNVMWHRPLDMFMSEVDHVKYPDSKQKYRFEKID